METRFNIVPVQEWKVTKAGLSYFCPCSAETEEQVMSTAKQLAALNKISVFRSASGNREQGPIHLKE